MVAASSASTPASAAAAGAGGRGQYKRPGGGVDSQHAAGGGGGAATAERGTGRSGVDLLYVARTQIPRSDSPAETMQAYRAYRDKIRRTVLSSYDILGFLSSGTYGRVYKASLKRHIASGPAAGGTSATMGWSSTSDDETSGRVFAIKKFKPDKEDHATYTGISQSAMREIALNRELRHENIISLREVVLEDKAIYMVFFYASHDLLQLIHHHSTVIRTGIALPVLKSLLFQLLNGVHYLHSQYVLHRDLKPANILLTRNGVVKIADLGLARIVQAPLQSLYSGDKVVVTIWYRAPELLLGARHYNAKIDMWAIGCIWGELLALRPMFKGEEAKMDPKTKTTPFQSDQFLRIITIMGNPTKERWPTIEQMPDYKHLNSMLRQENFANTLRAWYQNRALSSSGLDLFDALLQYDPSRRMSAKDALMHPWFQEAEPLPTNNAFASLPNGKTIYPSRRLIKDESDPKMVTTTAATAAQHHIAQHAAGAPSNSGNNAQGSNILYGAGTNTGAGVGGHVGPLNAGPAQLPPGGLSGPNSGLHAAPLSGSLFPAHIGAQPGAGPPAPPAASTSTGSTGAGGGGPSAHNSVGVSSAAATSAAIAGGGGGVVAADGPGSMAATAMANAAAQKRQNKRARSP